MSVKFNTYVVNNRVYITGPTYQIRQHLYKIGGFFNSQTREWFVYIHDKQKLVDLLNSLSAIEEKAND